MQYDMFDRSLRRPMPFYASGPKLRCAMRKKQGEIGLADLESFCRALITMHTMLRCLASTYTSCASPLEKAGVKCIDRGD
jgi:hypothetical protein